MTLELRSIYQSEELKRRDKVMLGIVASAPVQTFFRDKQQGFNKETPQTSSRIKAVSFHGVEDSKDSNRKPWCLQVKRSSASTNVSVLNLLAVGSQGFDEEGDESDLSSEISEHPLTQQDGDDEAAEETIPTSVLMKAKDSVMDLKEKSSWLRMQKAECEDLCENLEAEQVDTEELRKSCSELNEKLEHISKEMEDLRMKQIMASLHMSIKELQHSLDTTHATSTAERVWEKQEMTSLYSAMQDIRSSLAQISDTCEMTVAVQKNMQSLVFHMNNQMESVLSQVACAKKERELLMEDLQEMKTSMDSFHTFVEKIDSTYKQIESGLGSFCQLKPVWDEISRSVSSLGPYSTSDTGRGSSSSVLHQIMPFLLGKRDSNNHSDLCDTCSNLRKKLLDMETQMMEKHMQAKAIGSDLRMVQDDAIHLENLLSKTKLSSGGKLALLNMKMRMNYLEDRVSKLQTSQFSLTPEACSSFSKEPEY
ncbi:testis-specific serine kinase substrate [Hyperolius riggenbachi]|uniref:testis-specific serine kinase substrate n=1 Tax=Hyperolius riggenbachi TaxID=752182 RepID=UPI0035A35B51